MPRKSIPDEVKQQAEQIIARFNKRSLARTGSFYVPRWRGVFLFLDRVDHDMTSQICRLKYTGDIHKWEFAIFKYSSERYDPNEHWFPGAECVDGTIEGAMKAGLKAYSKGR